MKETKRLPPWIRKRMYYQDSFMHTEKTITTSIKIIETNLKD